MSRRLKAYVTATVLAAVAVLAIGWPHAFARDWGHYVAWVVIEGYFVVPVLMGRSMELNATTVILACLFWDLLWGLPGLFLAMPLMAGVKAICENVPDWRPWANLMSTRASDSAAIVGAAANSPDKTQIMTPEDFASENKHSSPAATERKQVI